jgi:hypothetical protein
MVMMLWRFVSGGATITLATVDEKSLEANIKMFSLGTSSNFMQQPGLFTTVVFLSIKG